MYYDYESTGTEQVEKLVKWLRNRSSQMILLCHSMGGLLAVDALRQLETLGVRLNVCALLAFDSPYFGLHPNVLLQSGVKRATSATESLHSVVKNVFGTRAGVFSNSQSAVSTAAQSAQSTAAQSSTTASTKRYLISLF